MAVLVESGLRIAVHALTKETLQNGTQGKGALTWYRADQEYASVAFTITRRASATACLHLAYCRNGENIAYDIRLMAEACRFGGDRWFAICPATGHKVSKLYLPPGARLFLARRAWRLSYASQNVASGLSRICNQLQRHLVGKLKSRDPDMPLKPKGMRWTTYNRHCEKLDHLQTAMDAAFLQRFGAHMEAFFKNSGNFGTEKVTAAARQ